MIITFCGHAAITETGKIKEWLDLVLEQYIYEDNVTFYLGGRGDFDRLAASVVRQKQLLNPTAKAVLIIAYLNQSYDDSGYDYTLYPPLESVPPRVAILKRNEWMVPQADTVIAYVTHPWGGAAKTLRYAQAKKKTILLYPDIR